MRIILATPAATSIYPLTSTCRYRKIPKIGPSMYKPPKLVTQKAFRKITPSNISPPGACTWKLPSNQVKQSKNDKFPSNYKASPTDF